MNLPLITILGPTASGKTTLAAKVASALGGEIISADSRQVYRGMDIGTGKDYGDYFVEGISVPYHLIDICDPGHEYSLYEFRQDFYTAWKEITGRKRLPVLCGGTGLYIESVLKDYRLDPAGKDPELEKFLERKTTGELTEMLKSLRPLHNTTDTLDRGRLIRAIGIARQQKNREEAADSPFLHDPVFGIRFERETLKQRITDRLKKRLETGMIGEVKGLLEKGVTPDQLKFYGLEYRYITKHIEGELSYDEMFRLLNIAIHQYSKRQMTWFRRMERSGVRIHWIQGELPLEDKLNMTVSVMENLSFPK
jgi:tRNA dimethylallyltransferase